MSAAIMVSFIIPAFVTIMLIGLMIKERNYLFPNKAGENWLKKMWIKAREKKNNSIDWAQNEKNQDNFWDLSGGSFGIW